VSVFGFVKESCVVCLSVYLFVLFFRFVFFLFVVFFFFLSFGLFAYLLGRVCCCVYWVLLFASPFFCQQICNCGFWGFFLSFVKGDRDRWREGKVVVVVVVVGNFLGF